MSLTNLSRLMQQAVLCEAYPSNIVTQFAWLEGKWVCTDRVIREYKPEIIDYLSLQTIEVESVESSFYGSTNFARIVVGATFTDRPKPRFPNRREVCVKGSDFYYDCGPNGGIPFWLKRQDSTRPDWFILEQQDDGDVFLFHRVEEEPPQKTPSANAESPEIK